MRIYQMNNDEVAQYLETDLTLGLEKVPNKNSKNSSGNGFGFIRSLFDLFRSKIYFVNFIAAICYLVALIFSWLNHSWLLLGLTIVSLILTLLIYFVEGILLNHYKVKYYERSVGARQQVSVIRSGELIDLDPSDLAVGDLICLNVGTVLYCDVRVVDGEGLFADEKTVFGSSIPAAKTASILSEENLTPEKQSNMIWKGSYITSGSGHALVTALDADCYVEKTGGRKKRKQRSFFYNQQNNIGKIASYIYVILSTVCLLTAIIFTDRYVEAFLMMGIVTSLISLNPINYLMEWTYYRTASVFYRQGILIKNIEAFDRMNDEKDVYFNVDGLIKDQLRYSHTIDLHGSEKSTLSYFSLCMGPGYFADELKKTLDDYGLSYEQLDRSFPVFRREIDDAGNVFSLFSNNGNSVVVATGYWKNMLSMVGTIDDELLEQIKELEIHGKMVYLMASDSMNIIPNKLDLSYFTGHMELSSFVVFDIPVNKKLLAMIAQLRHASMKVYLISDYSEAFSNMLVKSYDIDGVLTAPPEKQCYSICGSGNSSVVVCAQESSPIEREQAMVVLDSGVAPQDVVYKVKCMFCGIRRCMNFLAVTGTLLIFTVLSLFLMGVSMERMIFSIILLKPALLCPCYYLLESVRNCNQYRRSLIFGLFCGSAGFVAALVGCDTAIFALALSTVLLSAYFVFFATKHRVIKKQDIVFLVIAFLFVVLPVAFTGGYWLPSLLLALFPPLAAFVLDLFY